MINVEATEEFCMTETLIHINPLEYKNCRNPIGVYSLFAIIQNGPLFVPLCEIKKTTMIGLASRLTPLPSCFTARTLCGSRQKRLQNAITDESGDQA